jgi:thioredoxin 1
MSKARAVTEASFKDDVLDSEKTILVDFWAEWCGPCKAVGPILDEIADEHGDKIEIVKLNVDEHSQVAIDYGITSIPALKIFQNGKVVQTIIGAKPKAELESDLAAYIG